MSNTLPKRKPVRTYHWTTTVDKIVGNKLEQPKAGPKAWMVEVTVVSDPG